jgi:antirestriction protein ArdC
MLSPLLQSSEVRPLQPGPASFFMQSESCHIWDAAQIILDNCGAAFRVGGDRAFYAPELDLISLPPDAAFSSPAYWAATAIHEINHSTGHETRMKRDMSGKFGSDIYALEETRVDIAAAFVCNTLALPTDYVNHAAYIDHWMHKVKADKRELFRCAAEAQRIADWTLSYHPDFKTAHTSQPGRPYGPPEQPEAPRPAA